MISLSVQSFMSEICEGEGAFFRFLSYILELMGMLLREFSPNEDMIEPFEISSWIKRASASTKDLVL